MLVVLVEVGEVRKVIAGWDSEDPEWVSGCTSPRITRYRVVR